MEQTPLKKYSSRREGACADLNASVHSAVATLTGEAKVDGSRNRKANSKYAKNAWQNYNQKSAKKPKKNKNTNPPNFFSQNRQKSTVLPEPVDPLEKMIVLSQSQIPQTVEVPPRDTPVDTAEAAPIAEAEEETSDPNCPVCREEVENGQPGICCDLCKSWHHRGCLHMTEAIYEELQASTDPWYCMRCLAIKGNKISWGTMEGEETITATIAETYKEVTTWKKNLFLLPRGKAGTDFIVELTRLINLFINDTKWSRIALPLVHIFIPINATKT